MPITLQPRTKKMRIVFLIRALNYGGAQRQLITLVKGLQQNHDLRITVLYFYSGGELVPDLINSGVNAICLNKKQRWDIIGFFARLIRVLKELQPNVFHGYLGESNIVLALIKPIFFPKTPLIWGVRESAMGAERADWLGHFLGVAERPLYSLIDLIIANSAAGKRDFAQLGLSPAKIQVIPNGIDIQHFQRDRSLGLSVRQQWGISEETILIGLVARLDVMKDHGNFLRAAAALVKEPSIKHKIRFACIGKGVKEKYTQQLQTLTAELQMVEQVIWAGARGDMLAVYNALDILCSASAYGEGFSNVIGEAMACGVPCVVTDVGDAATIVGDRGMVVPPQDAVSLKTALAQTIINLPNINHQLIRNHIVDNFSVEKLVIRTEKAIKSIVQL